MGIDFDLAYSGVAENGVDPRLLGSPDGRLIARLRRFAAYLDDNLGVDQVIVFSWAALGLHEDGKNIFQMVIVSDVFLPLEPEPMGELLSAVAVHEGDPLGALLFRADEYASALTLLFNPQHIEFFAHGYRPERYAHHRAAGDVKPCAIAHALGYGIDLLAETPLGRERERHWP